MVVNKFSFNALLNFCLLLSKTKAILDRQNVLFLSSRPCRMIRYERTALIIFIKIYRHFILLSNAADKVMKDVINSLIQLFIWN